LIVETPTPKERATSEVGVPRCLASTTFFLRSGEYAFMLASCHVAQLHCKAL
jgi:hypothetical protein